MRDAIRGVAGRFNRNARDFLVVSTRRYVRSYMSRHSDIIHLGRLDRGSCDHPQPLEDAMAYKMLINGKLVDGAVTLDVFNPATGGVLATCPRADEAQLDEAVAAAKAAFPAWSALSFSERRKKLEAIADALETRANEFARLLTQEQGKPTTQAIGEVMGAVVGMRAFAAAEVETKVIRETNQERIIEQRTPLGVVGAI